MNNKKTWFAPQNGLFQMAFLNEDDIYDLPGLVRFTSADKYLCYRLKKAGYKNIWFWDRDTSGNIIKFPDAPSLKCFESQTTQHVYHPTDKSTRWNYIKLNSAQTSQMFSLAAQGNNDTALVMSAHVFCDFFSSPASRKLLQKIKNKSGRNMILLKMPVDADESSAFLFSEDTPLSEIFPAIAKASKGTLKTNVYGTLKKKMGDGMVFLNSLSRDDIFYTVSHRVLLDTESCTVNVGEIDLFTDFLYTYYHSESLRKELNNLLPRNDRNEVRIVDKVLCDGDYCSIIRRWCAGNDISAYAVSTTDVFVNLNTGGTLSRWMSISQKLQGEENGVYKGQLDSITASLVGAGKQGENKKEHFEFLFDALERSVEDGHDSQSIQDRLAALETWLIHSYKDSENKVWKLLEGQINTSDAAHAAAANADYIKKDIASLSGKLETVKSWIKEHYGTPNNIIPNRDPVADAKVRELTQLNELYNTNKSLLEQKLESALKMEGALQIGRTTIDSFRSDTADLDEKAVPEYLEILTATKSMNTGPSWDKLRDFSVGETETDIEVIHYQDTQSETPVDHGNDFDFTTDF